MSPAPKSVDLAADVAAITALPVPIGAGFKPPFRRLGPLRFETLEKIDMKSAVSFWKTLILSLPLVGLSQQAIAAGPGQPQFSVRNYGSTYSATTNPCPVYDLGPRSAPTYNYLVITNVGNADAKKFSVKLTGTVVPSIFELGPGDGGSYLPKGGEVVISIRFKPQAADASGTIYGGTAAQAALTISDPKAVENLTIPFRGEKQ